ncbi:hypothetical protein BU25DRAFT_346542 [Macroventuria anomochaeta]|uniref:Uncharacterized protein n=1 Tax=Macroventuria anomochaeta TaxID=301207 RepID=A0ACB6RTS1_9PLEO|nr:uncharacterized protein BU25DRAFT_346542 [Macroventuria anomochaeta]KAF2625112.1 hypothetical protein BU25DRAFT_346542 [Macroventuria anomochaeta]
MLWAEAANETALRNSAVTDNTAITIGRFGERVFSQIRRFVVVRVNRQSHYVHACAISTYGGRGATKWGVRASEHAIVYLNGSQPAPYPGEHERGLTKDPLRVDPTDPKEKMDPASRVRLGKIYSIEWNVKVRDIGMIAATDRSRLMKYFKEEQSEGFEPDNEFEDEPTIEPQEAYRQPGKYTQHFDYFPATMQPFSSASTQAQYPQGSSPYSTQAQPSYDEPEWYFPATMQPFSSASTQAQYPRRSSPYSTQAQPSYDEPEWKYREKPQK